MHRELSLFDTHTHFDVEDFDHDRQQLAEHASQQQVKALVLIGFVQQRFAKLIDTHHWLNQLPNAPRSYLAPGLHPFYIEQHTQAHLIELEGVLNRESCVAIGEIGLDTFLKQHKQPDLLHRQREFFSVQLELAKQFELPVLLHIRKSHADVLAMLKKHQFSQGGIAHAFSGGVEEAKAFIKLGFKLGVTGQITNPNARKLHQVVESVGLDHLVLETDCPDMTPLCCQTSHETRTRNTPGNLIYVLEGLAQRLDLPIPQVVEKLWQNSMQALHLRNE